MGMTQTRVVVLIGAGLYMSAMALPTASPRSAFGSTANVRRCSIATTRSVKQWHQILMAAEKGTADAASPAAMSSRWCRDG